ncbi:MAG: transcription antitermination protein NusB [Alphaproteobacteria bacterium]|nr:transcription antitermination protein NusB [Alphaproteobacteria bacterium]
MSEAEKEISADKPSHKAQVLSARLLAVQALYQMKQNKQPVKTVYDEYILHRSEQEVDGQKLVTPDGALFKQILYGVEERYVELDAVMKANLKKDASDRFVEPLLYSVLLCGAYELLAHSDIDAPIIINDYLNVGHAFFEKNEVALINGVLDSLAKLFR